MPLVPLLMLLIPSPGPQNDVLRTEPTTREAVAPAAHVGYYRQPALHGDMIVFVAEGDLWRVSAAGGVASRLTSHPEVESRPAISPDGGWLAYSASYEGPREVWLMPLAGGRPVRQTWEGGSAEVAGWTPDGRILYATGRYATLPNSQVVALNPCTAEPPQVSACSPAPERLPLWSAWDGSWTPDGATFFFTRVPQQSSYTKRYVGGTAQSIWRWRRGAEAEPLTADYPGTSRNPLVWNGRVYFASDRAPAGTAHSLREHGVAAWDAGVVNVWSMDENGGDLRQHTFHTDYDVEDLSLNGGRIVYQQGADLWLLDLRQPSSASSMTNPHKLDITLASDFEQMRENWVERPAQYLTSTHVSTDGSHVALVARGRIFVAPVGPGRLMAIEPQANVRYRDARFLPGTDRLVALSDESGEVEVWTLPANGIGEKKQLTKDAEILRWDALPSPDGRWIAHYDKNQDLYLYDTKDGSNRRIAHSDRASSWISSAPSFNDIAWSPDGRWLAYNDVAENFLGRITLYDTGSGTATPVTTDRYDSYSPAWSADGKWLYFLSDRNFVSQVGSPWGARQPDPFFDQPTQIFAVALVKDAKWPFQPRNELNATSPSPASGAASGSRSGAQARAGAARQADSAAVRVSIDFDGITTRLYEVPVPAGNLASLSANGARLYWLARTREPRRTNLMSLAIGNDPSAKPAAVIEDIAGYELTGDRKKIMVRKGQDLYVFNAGAKAPTSLTDSKVDLSGWSFSVDPAEEWSHNFEDAWRLERDYFYDPGMNGIDWPAMREKYRPLAARVTDRTELNDVLAQMVGELSALHIFVRGGDVRTDDQDIAVGSLGAVLERDDDAGGWRVAHIWRSDPDMPDALGPLARPDVNVSEGDVITAIDGVNTLSVADPAVLLRNRVGKQTRLSVVPAPAAPAPRPANASASAPASRDVVVTPISQGQERNLRYTEWEYTRRLATDSLGGGRVGYVHLRAMGGGNIAEWNREYYPVFNRDALVINVRHNTGGNIDSWLLGKLLRRVWFWWQPRVGEPYANMPYSFRGPIVVLVDERTASDGEAFAEGFRRLGLGKVLGVRTWGGEIWLSSSNFLADRGIATAAEQGVYADGKWLIEGWGVEPDIIVDNLPVATFNGGDAQLEAGVKYLLDQLATTPVTVPPPPPYPKKGGSGG